MGYYEIVLLVEEVLLTIARGIQRVLRASWVVIACCIIPAPAQAQGDLYYPEVCNGWIEATYGESDLYVGVFAEIWDDHGAMWDDDWDEDWGRAEAVAEGEVPARQTNQTIHCYNEYYVQLPEYYISDEGSGGPSDDRAYKSRSGLEWWDSDSWTWVEPHAGPASVDWLIRAFIPDDNITAPETVYAGYSVRMEGDNRNFSTGGSHRIQQSVGLNNQAYTSQSFSSAQDPDVGMSRDYDGRDSLDGAGLLTGTARSDWQWNTPLKMFWDTASDSGFSCDAPDKLGQQFGSKTSSIRLRCNGGAAYPLFAGSPEINWDYTLTLTFSQYGVYYNLGGCHDFFPAHEVYLNGQPILQHTQTGEWALAYCSTITVITGQIGL